MRRPHGCRLQGAAAACPTRVRRPTRVPSLPMGMNAFVSVRAYGYEFVSSCLCVVSFSETVQLRRSLDVRLDVRLFYQKYIYLSIIYPTCVRVYQTSACCLHQTCTHMHMRVTCACRG